MKKILSLLFFLSGAALSSFAQTKTTPQLSLGAEIGLPTGQASQVYNLVAGGSLKFEAPISASAFNITVTAGYNSYVVKGIYAGYIENSSYIPVELGGKYYFNKNVYFEGDLGASFNINSNYTGPKAAFIYAPILGVSLPASNGNAVDLGLRYEGRSEPGGTVSLVALRIAYTFGL